MKEGRPAVDLPSDRDELFVHEANAPQAFRFDEAVAKVFPDMLRRSIPGYSTLLHLIGVAASSHVQSGTHVYDLGCSLGAVSLSIRHAIGARDAKIVALDSSSAMVARCQEIISADSALCPVDVIQGDISALDLKPASLVVLNFTLQFAPKEARQQILNTISESLVDGGALILSEKTTSDDAGVNQFYTQTHDNFRQSNGYSRIELSRKREALETYLIPEKVETYEEQLRRAGLEPVQWFRCLHFVSWVATKASR